MMVMLDVVLIVEGEVLIFVWVMIIFEIVE